MRIAIAAMLLMALPGGAQAMEWRLGMSYATGLSDVADLYEENLRLAGFDANVDLKFPVGVAASFVYDWTSEIRTDIGIGPMFLIGGDIEHSEVPLTATAGYSFAPFSRVSPYIRAGVAHHFASGDQYRSSSPGLFAAIGVDFTHVAIEIATDQSKVEFDELTCAANGGSCQLGSTEFSTYDVLVSAYWRFRLNR